ncbi:hypothetical protein QF019_003055 [Pseudomonas frederiksbergensis]|uniref:hypothetical protein n=1 Tax=Pseudomonas frederiksbergensis TaxID=104087 RepID=UPI003D19981F
MSSYLDFSIGLLTTKPDGASLANNLQNYIAHVFSESSEQDIHLKVRNRGLLGDATNVPVFSDTLHQALEGMTGYQRGSNHVSHIGMLIADSFEPAPNFFGLMFDEAFAPDSSDPWAWTPREGCAVFLDGIKKARPGSSWMEEAIFTAVHELGHVFNLQHNEAPSFMTQTAAKGPIPLNDALFTPIERRLLSCCSTSPFIWPGGSAFSDLGGMVDDPISASSANRPAVHLHIGASQDTFWAFEPVELDLRLTARNKRSTLIPDALDAGYSEFTIWIDQPNGERRKLRSPRHYCAPRGTLRLASGEHFERDISIFGQAGGYTFVNAGIHRVWCEFSYSPTRRVVSNMLELEVKSRAPTSKYWQDASTLLEEKHTAQLLYYRRLNPERRVRTERLQHFIEAYRRQPTTPMLHYALGRAFAQEALSLHRTGAAIRDARHHLKAAAKNGQLGDHRQHLAENVLRKLG